MKLTHRRSRQAFRGHTRDRARGAVLVEAAIITPVFFMLVLGIFEIGLAMNDKLALAHAVRAGSRVASASGNDLFADYGIVQSVKRESAAIPRSQVVRVVVYRADRYGQPPSDTCKAGTPASAASSTRPCNVYTAADLDRPKAHWGCQPGYNLERWCPTTRKVSLTGNGPEYVGVWAQVDHEWITKMFGARLTLTDESVIRLEPRVKE